jgi:hypothetical protein
MHYPADVFRAPAADFSSSLTSVVPSYSSTSLKSSASQASCSSVSRGGGGGMMMMMTMTMIIQGEAIASVDKDNNADGGNVCLSAKTSFAVFLKFTFQVFSLTPGCGLRSSHLLSVEVSFCFGGITQRKSQFSR